MEFDIKHYLEDLKFLCAIDSGLGNGAGCGAIADWFELQFGKLGLHVDRRQDAGSEYAPFLLIENGPSDTKIDTLMIAHLDTVFPEGDGQKRPLSVDDEGIGRAPGCVDCKGGALLILYIVRKWVREGVDFHFAVALNSDEESGSTHSRTYFESLARRTRYCFVFEPGRANGEFVSQRKSVGDYLITCRGVAAHAGVNPQAGANAIVEMARWIDRLNELNDYESGTTLNVSRIGGGGEFGQVPDFCQCGINFRYLDENAEFGLFSAFEDMKHPYDPRTSIEIEKVSLRPVMRLNPATKAMLADLKAVGDELGQNTDHVTTGGGSDGNWIAPFGVATLDGCGPRGGKLHTEDEYIVTESVSERFELMDQLIRRVANRREN